MLEDTNVMTETIKMFSSGKDVSKFTPSLESQVEPLGFPRLRLSGWIGQDLGRCRNSKLGVWNKNEKEKGLSRSLQNLLLAQRTSEKTWRTSTVRRARLKDQPSTGRMSRKLGTGAWGKAECGSRGE